MNISSKIGSSVITSIKKNGRGVTSLKRPQSTFVSQTLPVISQVHHPNRVQENTLLPWCDVSIPEIPYCEYLWGDLASHAHLPGLVCGLTDRTILHGEVWIFYLHTKNKMKFY